MEKKLDEREVLTGECFDFLRMLQQEELESLEKIRSVLNMPRTNGCFAALITNNAIHNTQTLNVSRVLKESERINLKTAIELSLICKKLISPFIISFLAMYYYYGWDGMVLVFKHSFN